MDAPLVSVIIPVYNVSEYLRRCLDSVVKQVYTELEIILIDDGSCDGSDKICDEYAATDNRIKVIHKQNGGLSDARNEGIIAAVGDYIAFIDSDDFVDTNYIYHLLKIMLEYNADIAICGYVKGTANVFPKMSKKDNIIQCFKADEMLHNWHGKYKHIETVAWNKLYKRELFYENNIWYPKGFYNEDVQTTHLLVRQAKKVVITSEKMYYYFQRKESITGNISKKKIEDNIYSQNERLKFFYERGYMEAYQRLSIKLQKYYMLMYCKININNSEEIKTNLMEMYLSNLKNLKTFKVITLKEKILFYSFKKHYKLFDKIFKISGSQI